MATFTQSAPTLWRFQCDPAADGSYTVQAFFRTTLANDDDPADILIKDGGSVMFILPPELAAQVHDLAIAARG